MNQNQAKTVGVAGVAGAIVTLVIALGARYGITVSPDVNDALLTLIVAGLGWVTHREPTPAAPAPAQEAPHA